MAKKLKDVVKMNPEPARGKVGIDPTDPWSAKANIAESASLNQYLLSRGINPKFVSPETKISHAKSSAFLKWKMNHQFEEIQTEEVDKADTLTFDIPLMVRMLELAREDVKDDMELHRITERLISIRNKGTLTMDDYDFIAGIKKLKEEIEAMAEGRMKDIATDAAETQRLNKMTTLQKFRADSGARAKKHADIEKSSGGMTSAIDRLEKHLNKEEIVTEMDKSQDAPGRDTDHKLGGKEYTGTPVKAKKFHTGVLKSLNKAFNKPVKEEVELNEDNLDSIAKKHGMEFKRTTYGAGMKHPTKGEISINRYGEWHHKGTNKTGDSTSNFSSLDKHLSTLKEDTLDPLAATQSPGDMGTNPNDTTERQKGMSKSARIIKSLYKRKGVVKEDMYDHEKEDKSVQSYGKKPKVMEPDEKKNLGEKKPDARIVMSGGTTLTGEKRDTVEIDPLMKNRPGPDTFGATGKKASQQ